MNDWLDSRIRPGIKGKSGKRCNLCYRDYNKGVISPLPFLRFLKDN